PIIMQAVMLMTKVPYGNFVPIRPAIVEPIQYLAIDPSAPPNAISKYFCKPMPPSRWARLRCDSRLHCSSSSEQGPVRAEARQRYYWKFLTSFEVERDRHLHKSPPEAPACRQTGCSIETAHHHNGEAPVSKQRQCFPV